MSKADETDRTDETAPGGAAVESADADEAVTEAAAGEVPEGVEGLRTELEAARSEAAAHWDAVLRSRAELENLRKRMEREVENAHRYGIERLVAELLPVKDGMELGLAAATGDDPGTSAMREGMQLTLKMLDAALGKFGVTAVDPAGEPFDPERHQAMSMQEAPGTSAGTVITVVQKGYLLNDRLVRPAMVIVAK